MANNIENLRRLTSEEAREVGSLGGKASVKARRKKRELKKLLEIALSQPWEENPDEDNYMGITVALMKKAADGDVKAYEMIAKMVGQLPKEEIELATKNIRISITDDEEDA